MTNPTHPMTHNNRFKPTPYNITETECDDLGRDFDRRGLLCLAADDTAGWSAWMEAKRLLSEARDRSFKARSTAKRDRLRKRLGMPQLTPA